MLMWCLLAWCLTRRWKNTRLYCCLTWTRSIERMAVTLLMTRKIRERRRVRVSYFCMFNVLQVKLQYTTYLTLHVDHRPLVFIHLCLMLSCAAASIFLQLYTKPAIHVSFPDLFCMSFLVPSSSVALSVSCSTCLVMLSSLFFSTCV